MGRFMRMAVVAVCLLGMTATVPASNGKGFNGSVTTLDGTWDGLITPTYAWVNLYGDSLLLDDVPVMPGDTIKVYDADGVLCGIDTVRSDGSWGFLPVYRDDEHSDEDEGAEPGDTLYFEIAGIPAMTTPVITWTMNGDGFPVSEFESIVPDSFVTVLVDIKPGTCRNPFNLTGNLSRGKSVIKVAILGTDEFDVNDIDAASVTLAGAPAVRWNYGDESYPAENADDSCVCHESGSDGYDDLNIKFYRADIAAGMDDPADREIVPLQLTGYLTDGTEIRGFDCVWVLNNDRGPNGKSSMTPADFGLGNYPNPFNPTTTISFNLPEAGVVSLDVFNVRGELVTTLVSGRLEAGQHEVQWNSDNSSGQAVASGVYFYRLSAAGHTTTHKMLLLK